MKYENKLMNDFIAASEKGDENKIMEILNTFIHLQEEKNKIKNKILDYKSFFPLISLIDPFKIGCSSGFQKLCKNGHVNIIEKLSINTNFTKFCNIKEGIDFFIKNSLLKEELNNKELNTIRNFVQKNLFELPKKQTNFKQSYMQIRYLIKTHDELSLLRKELTEDLNLVATKSNKKKKI